MAFQRLGPHVCKEYFPLYYTFGIEIEALVRIRLEDYGVQCVEDGTRIELRNRMRKVVAEAGHPVRWDDFEQMQPGKSSSPDDLLGWVITSDYSCKEGLRSKVYGFVPIELNSPVRKFTRLPNYDPFREISEVLSLLKYKFDLYVNETCSFQVHVGAVTDPSRQDYRFSRGFPLATVRNLMQLGSLFEQELSALHPKSRFSNRFALTPHAVIHTTRQAVKLMATLPNFEQLHWLWMGLHLKDYDANAQEKYRTELGLDGGWRNAIYFGNLINEKGRSGFYNPPNPFILSRSRRTIEFRQHAGTLDFFEMYHWIRTCVRLIQFCHECGPNGLPLWLLHAAEVREAGKPYDSVVDPTGFLRMIGAHEQAAFYDERGTYDHDFHDLKIFRYCPTSLRCARKNYPEHLVPLSLPDTADDITRLWERYPGMQPPQGVEQEERDDNGNFPDLLYNGKEYEIVSVDS
ncbi:hypothetical protein VTN31DRAFT_1292 [Thermomyces dupontii]|uniref:uncharacterized protein n=1 Tax=Talaromyces thermophilus TaxID=28565 RepID=UPI00374210FE